MVGWLGNAQETKPHIPIFLQDRTQQWRLPRNGYEAVDDCHRRSLGSKRGPADTEIP